MRTFSCSDCPKPLFVINGGKDRLYPISIVEPYTRHLMRNGVEIAYFPQAEGQHNTAWWAQWAGWRIAG